jgi:hypothetical protein
MEIFRNIVEKIKKNSEMRKSFTQKAARTGSRDRKCCPRPYLVDVMTRPITTIAHN